jgi:hypothetical protein
MDFLKAIKTHFKPTAIKHLGDETDKHAMSYHETDPNLHSASDELAYTKECLKDLYKLFPKVDVMNSNHGSMHFRKAKTAGIPKQYIRSIKDVLGAPKGWNWHDNQVIQMNNGKELFIAHHIEKNVLFAAQRRGMCVAQGHFHSRFCIETSCSSGKLNWGMTVGCLIDDASMAFAYNKVFKERPVIGCGIVIDGFPRLIPMALDKHGRWKGKLYV